MIQAILALVVLALIAAYVIWRVSLVLATLIVLALVGLFRASAWILRVLLSGRRP